MTEGCLIHLVVHDALAGVFARALVVDVVGRVGEYHIGLGAEHEPRVAALVGAVGALDAMRAQLVDVAWFGAGCLWHWRHIIVLVIAVEHQLAGEARQVHALEA